MSETQQKKGLNFNSLKTNAKKKKEKIAKVTTKPFKMKKNSEF